jgi:hypothetical protein
VKYVRRLGLFLLLGLLLLLVASESAFTQMSGGRGGRGKGGAGKGKGRMDPAALFNMYSGGQPTIDVNNVQVPDFMQRFQSADQVKEAMQAFLQKKGVSNGQMTPELFQEYNEERRQEMRARFSGMRGKRGGPPPAPAEGASPASPGTPGDAGGSGGPDSGGRGRGPADGQPGAWPQSPAAPPPPVEAPRPTVYRVGKLPKGLPAWFAQLDRDRDAQVGLYEWTAAGRSVDEFVAMDLNGDGFLTPEEVLRFLKAQKPAPGAGPASPPGGRRGPGGMPPGRPSRGAPDQGALQ